MSLLRGIHRITSNKRHLLTNDQISDTFGLPRGSASPEPILPLLLDALVGLDTVPEHLSVGGSNNARVNV
jgi:hypothetical protein